MFLISNCYLQSYGLFSIQINVTVSARHRVRRLAPRRGPGGFFFGDLLKKKYLTEGGGDFAEDWRRCQELVEDALEVGGRGGDN